MAEDTRDDEMARRLRAGLAADLAGAGHLPASWRPAFEKVPRHHFMPWLFIAQPDGRYAPLDGRVHRAEWLRHVYTDQVCVTQLGGDDTARRTATAEGVAAGVQTAVSSEPGVMAWMLDSLAVRDGHRVLEIGTGTGYNAALLCERLGSALVTSIDIDSRLAAAASAALAGLGYHPVVAAADGRHGYPSRAPYDRIIATCSWLCLPNEWVDQTRPHGRILVNLAGLLGGAMLLAEVAGDGTARGRFLRRWAGFLPARPGPPGAGDIIPQDTRDGSYDTGTTCLSPQVLDHQVFGFLAWLATGDAQPYWAESGQGRLSCLIGRDGSWAEVYPPGVTGRRLVEQGGPRRLWHLVEEAHELWLRAGRPDCSRFTFHARPDRQVVRLACAGISRRWELATACSAAANSPA